MLRFMSSFGPKIPDPDVSTDGGRISQDGGWASDGLDGGRVSTDGGWLTGTDGGSMLTDGGRSPQITQIV